MSRLITIFSFFIVSHTSICQDISGHWEGYLDQTQDALASPGYQVYWNSGLWKRGDPTHVIKMTFDGKNNFTGTYYLTPIQNPNVFGKFTIKGTFNGNQLNYRTIDKLSEVKWNGLGFCYNEGNLTYNTEDDFEYLTGNWNGWDDYGRKCASAVITMRRKVKMAEKIIPESQAEEKQTSIERDLKDREVVTKDFVQSNINTFTFTIYDNMVEDYDTISIQLNNTWIVQNYHVSKKKQEFTVPIQRGENILILVAKNLGLTPPNTAAISYKKGNQKKITILNSYTDKSEAIKIYGNF